MSIGRAMRVVVSRDPVIESVHQVDAVVADPAGPRLIWGDGQRPTLARSGLKLVQALPLVHTGAADHFGLSDDELALACASHSGEPGHVEAVLGWLERLGLDEGDLVCGSAATGPAENSRPAAHNCSGKHAGFLTVARHLDHDIDGYAEPDHPVQQLVGAAIAALCQVDLDDQIPGRDGCGIPTWSVPLAALAGAMARLSRPAALGPPLSEAAGRLVAAVQPRPWWISGTGRHEVETMARVAEPVVLKAGAEGVFMGLLPERGLGIAVKAADGAARAAEVAVSAVLAHLGVVAPEAVAQPVHNSQGLVVGSIEAEAHGPQVLG